MVPLASALFCNHPADVIVARNELCFWPPGHLSGEQGQGFDASLGAPPQKPARVYSRSRPGSLATLFSGCVVFRTLRDLHPPIRQKLPIRAQFYLRSPFSGSLRPAGFWGFPGELSEKFPNGHGSPDFPGFRGEKPACLLQLWQGSGVGTEFRLCLHPCERKASGERRDPEGLLRRGIVISRQRGCPRFRGVYDVVITHDASRGAPVRERVGWDRVPGRRGAPAGDAVPVFAGIFPEDSGGEGGCACFDRFLKGSDRGGVLSCGVRHRVQWWCGGPWSG